MFTHAIHRGPHRALIGVATASLAVPLAITAAPAGAADDASPDRAATAGSVTRLAPGATASVLWSRSTHLFDGRGKTAPGLRSSANGANGVSDIKINPAGYSLVAEKSGRIVLFGRTAHSGTVLTNAKGADLTPEVLSSTDTGLGGAVLDPQWPKKPYVYALYTSNQKLPGQGSGRWKNSQCPDDGRCIVNGRLERLTTAWHVVGGRRLPYVSARKTLLPGGFCQAARTHSTGDLDFGADGMLYVSAGDGTLPLGGSATQHRLCRGTVSTKYPSQMAPLDALDPSLRPSFNGKILRLDPATGQGAPGNPWYTSQDTARKRIVAMGFRNPYRIAVRPGTNELAISMAGQTKRDGVVEVAKPSGVSTPTNAGWPCWEASLRFSDGPLCKGLSQQAGTVVKPQIEWQHGQPVAAGEQCASADPSVSMGVTYASSTAGPEKFRKALVFNDFGRGCMWIRPNGGKPQWLASFDRQSIRAMATRPDGTLLVADYRAGAVLQLKLG